MSGTHSKTCHWCTYKSQPAPECSRRAWGDYRTHLPENHPLRGASAEYGRAEDRDPPPVRTHAEFVRDAEANIAHEKKLFRKQPRVFKKDLPYKRTGRPLSLSLCVLLALCCVLFIVRCFFSLFPLAGVRELSPLRWIFLFDLVWDVLPDMMHVIYGVWGRHFLPLFGGMRNPAPVRPRKTWTVAQNKALLQSHQDCLHKIEQWKVTKVPCKFYMYRCYTESFINVSVLVYCVSVLYWY